MSSGLNFNYEREVEQLRIAIEFHEQQKGRLESRIRELKNELKSGGGELSLVTGEMGAGTTTSSISIAERDDNPIISNLESLEDAYYAESWAQVESILKEQSGQQFTIQIDEYTGIDDGYEFVQEMLKRGHHVILVVPNRDYLHPWLRDLADTEHYISEREFDGIFPPRRSFDTCEIPRFDFTKPPEAYPRAEFEDESKDDLTQVSGVGEDEEQILNAGGYEIIDDLREATQSDLANIRIGNALAARIKADVGEVEQDEELSLSEFLELSRGQQRKRVKIALAQQTADDELDKDLFSPDERFPAQFHLDNLESQLEYNLGEIDGFLDLDWQSKCDLARLAVDHDLSRSELETVLDLRSDAGGSDV